MNTICFSLSVLLLPLVAAAIDPSIIRVSAQTVINPANNSFGYAVALNETYFVVGESLTGFLTGDSDTDTVQSVIGGVTCGE